MTHSSCTAPGWRTELLWLRLTGEIHPSPHNHPGGDVPIPLGNVMMLLQRDPLSAESCTKPHQNGDRANGQKPRVCSDLETEPGAIYQLCIGKKMIVGKETRRGCRLEMFWSGFSTPLCPIFHDWDVFLLWVRFTPGLKLPFGSLSTSLLFPLQV